MKIQRPCVNAENMKNLWASPHGRIHGSDNPLGFLQASLLEPDDVLYATTSTTVEEVL